MKYLGILIFIIILLLLFFSFFFNIYEFPEDKESENINADGTLMLSITYFIISLLSFVYLKLNGLNKNKGIAYPIYTVGIVILLRLIYILIFYYQG